MRTIRRTIERSRRRRGEAARRRGARALRSLSASLMALPGLAGSAGAETPAGEFEADYSFSFYAEHDLPASRVTPGGETQRYEVEAHQLRTQISLFDRLEFGVDVVHESMSGASPWYVVPGDDGDPVEVMTGATIEDARTDVLGRTSYYLDHGRAGLSGGVSWENDYLAFNAALDGERSFNEGNTTLLSGAGVSIDTIQPTDAETDPFRPEEEHKQSYSAFVGFAHVVSRSSVLQSTISYEHATGYLSDPYKRVLIAGEPVGESRPDTRNRFSWLSRYRHHFAATDSTLHLDYRLYYDDWEINSHTVDLGWYQPLFWGLRLVPSFRYYSQSQAEFYAPWFEAAPSSGHASSDYRLSPFGALSFRIRADVGFELWRTRLLTAFSWERYLSSGDFALGKVKVASPGLVDFDVFTVSLQTRF